MQNLNFVIEAHMNLTENRKKNKDLVLTRVRPNFGMRWMFYMF